MSFFYCKKCKHDVKPIDYWYLFDNAQFTNRIAIVGKCPKCKEDVILLTETRKEDYKIFNQLEVGKKAEHVGSLVIHQIDYTYSDSQQVNEQLPYGWTYGKWIKSAKEKCWKIFRSDFSGNQELIGYIPFNKSKILTEEEFRKVQQ